MFKTDTHETQSLQTATGSTPTPMEKSQSRDRNLKNTNETNITSNERRPWIHTVLDFEDWKDNARVFSLSKRSTSCIRRLAMLKSDTYEKKQSRDRKRKKTNRNIEIQMNTDLGPTPDWTLSPTKHKWILHHSCNPRCRATRCERRSGTGPPTLPAQPSSILAMWEQARVKEGNVRESPFPMRG